MSVTKEPQNQILVEEYETVGPVQLGPWASNVWRHDPRHLVFTAARYKFVAKILSGKTKVVEIGCGDGIGTPIVLQEVGFLHGIDIEPIVICDVEARFRQEKIQNCAFEVKDIVQSPLTETFDAAFSLDVVEHIPSKLETKFMEHICAGLVNEGVCLIGTPNITSAPYASKLSQEGHINLKSGPELKTLVSRYFHNVFLFSMNDEVVHTGFTPMAHYLIAMGVGKR